MVPCIARRLSPEEFKRPLIALSIPSRVEVGIVNVGELLISRMTQPKSPRRAGLVELRRAEKKVRSRRAWAMLDLASMPGARGRIRVIARCRMPQVGAMLGDARYDTITRKMSHYRATVRRYGMEDESRFGTAVSNYQTSPRIATRWSRISSTRPSG